MRITLLGTCGLSLQVLSANGGIDMLSNREIEQGIREWQRKIGIGHLYIMVMDVSLWYMGYITIDE